MLTAEQKRDSEMRDRFKERLAQEKQRNGKLMHGKDSLKSLLEIESAATAKLQAEVKAAEAVSEELKRCQADMARQEVVADDLVKETADLNVQLEAATKDKSKLKQELEGVWARLNDAMANAPR